MSSKPSGGAFLLRELRIGGITEGFKGGSRDL